MHGINRYIIKQILIGFIIVTIGLVSLIWLTQSLNYIDLILDKGIGVDLFLKMTMLLMPTFVVFIMPISLFAVIVFVYNKLISDRELIVMKAAGMSPLQLAKPAIIMAMFLSVVAYFLCIIYVPRSVRDFREMKWQVQNNASHLFFKEGEFNNISDGLTVFIKKKIDNGILSGIMIHDDRIRDKKITLMAENGKLVYADTGPMAVLSKGSRQETSSKGEIFSILYFDTYSMEFGSVAKSDGNRMRDARERTLKELFTLTTENSSVLARDIPKFRVEGHKRLSSPLYCITFALIACVGLLCSNFNRRGQNKQVYITIGAMVFLQALSLAIENSAVKNLMLVPLIYINILAPMAICLYLLVKHNPNKRKKNIAEYKQANEDE